jgi:hypothetical protein
MIRLVGLAWLLLCDEFSSERSTNNGVGGECPPILVPSVILDFGLPTEENIVALS